MDAPVGWADSAGDTCAVYAALKDARRGQCTSGTNCGCGAADNYLYIGDSSFGRSADEVSCVILYVLKHCTNLLLFFFTLGMLCVQRGLWRQL